MTSVRMKHHLRRLLWRWRSPFTAPNPVMMRISACTSVIQLSSTVHDQSTNCKELSVASANQCTDGHGTEDSSTKQLQGDAILELQCSVSVENDDRISDSEGSPPLELEDTTLEVDSSRASKVIDEDNFVSLSSTYHDSSNKSQTENFSSDEDTSRYSSNSTCEKAKQSPAALELTTSQSAQVSIHSAKMSFSDDGTSCSILHHQDGLQTVAGNNQHPSPHQLASADQSIESSPQPIAGSCLDGHITGDIYICRHRRATSR